MGDAGAKPAKAPKAAKSAKTAKAAAPASDSGDDWFKGDPQPDLQKITPKAPKPAKPTAAPPPPKKPEPAVEISDDDYLDPDKLLLFKHWIRPRFLQYHYLYDYRHNYYDDVIDYLDKRQKGLRREIPKPQTWAERALRTYTSKLTKDEDFKKRLEDTKLVEVIRLSGSFHHYHSREYINRRYSHLL